MDAWYRFWWYAYQPLIKMYFRISSAGMENIPSAGPVILAANHCSYLDPFLITLCVRRQIYQLARESLFRNPLFAKLIWSYGARPISRSDARGLKSALTLLQEDKTLLLFPEGTRTRDGNLQRLKTGAAWLAV